MPPKQTVTLWGPSCGVSHMPSPVPWGNVNVSLADSRGRQQGGTKVKSPGRGHRCTTRQHGKRRQKPETSAVYLWDRPLGS
jgi:hypothetical protein